MKQALLPALLALFVAHSPGGAGELDALVRGWYRPYEKDTADSSALQLLLPHASKRLAALIAKEERCAARNGICNLDFDVIINAQDWQLKNLRVESAKLEGDRASVVARFTNIDTRQEIIYRFVRQSEGWRLDDVEARLPATHRWMLSRILTRS